jgi:hypothetical protein
MNRQDDSHAPPRKTISPSPLEKRENTEKIKAKKQPCRNPNDVCQNCVIKQLPQTQVL